jgi:hypothetical protein
VKRASYVRRYPTWRSNVGMLRVAENDSDGIVSVWSFSLNFAPTSTSSRYCAGTGPSARLYPLLPTWSCTQSATVSLASQGNVHWRPVELIRR